MLRRSFKKRYERSLPAMRTFKRKDHGEMRRTAPNRVLKVIIHDCQIEVTTFSLYYVFSYYGLVLRIVLFDKLGQKYAMVEYDSIEGEKFQEISIVDKMLIQFSELFSCLTSSRLSQRLPHVLHMQQARSGILMDAPAQRVQKRRDEKLGFHTSTLSRSGAFIVQQHSILSSWIVLSTITAADDHRHAIQSHRQHELSAASNLLLTSAPLQRA